MAELNLCPYLPLPVKAAHTWLAHSHRWQMSIPLSTSPFSLFRYLASDPYICVTHDIEYVVAMWIVKHVYPHWSMPQQHSPPSGEAGWQECWGVPFWSSQCPGMATDIIGDAGHSAEGRTAPPHERTILPQMPQHALWKTLCVYSVGRLLSHSVN